MNFFRKSKNACARLTQMSRLRGRVGRQFNIENIPTQWKRKDKFEISNKMKKIVEVEQKTEVMVRSKEEQSFLNGIKLFNREFLKGIGDFPQIRVMISKNETNLMMMWFEFWQKLFLIPCVQKSKIEKLVKEIFTDFEEDIKTAESDWTGMEMGQKKLGLTLKLLEKQLLIMKNLMNFSMRDSFTNHHEMFRISVELDLLFSNSQFWYFYEVARKANLDNFDNKYDFEILMAELGIDVMSFLSFTMSKLRKGGIDNPEYKLLIHLNLNQKGNSQVNERKMSLVKPEYSSDNRMELEKIEGFVLLRNLVNLNISRLSLDYFIKFLKLGYQRQFENLKKNRNKNEYLKRIVYYNRVLLTDPDRNLNVFYQYFSALVRFFNYWGLILNNRRHSDEMRYFFQNSISIVAGLMTQKEINEYIHFCSNIGIEFDDLLPIMTEVLMRSRFEMELMMKDLKTDRSKFNFDKTTNNFMISFVKIQMLKSSKSLKMDEETIDFTNNACMFFMKIMYA